VRRRILLDTGPLVAFLNRRDRYRTWASDRLAQIEPPLDTCEAVLSEACYLLRGLSGGPAAVLALVERGLLRVTFRLADEAPAVRKLMRRYADLPMSLADACLVRLAELETESAVLTLDHHFTIYRVRGRQALPAILPEKS